MVCRGLTLWLRPTHPTSQAVIQNPFSNGGSPAGESVAGETRFAYFPAATVSDGTAAAVSVQAAADPALTQAGGESAPYASRRGPGHSHPPYAISRTL